MDYRADCGGQPSPPNGTNMLGVTYAGAVSLNLVSRYIWLEPGSLPKEPTLDHACSREL
jgi:hypothetical protein